MDRSYEAYTHNLEMLQHESYNIRGSLAGADVFGGDVDYMQPSKRRCTQIIIDNISTEEAIFGCVKDSNRIAALCFSDFETPGGSYMSGGSGQEEDLCHVSTLYQVLDGCKSYYIDNSYNINGGAYANRALYLPLVLFSAGDNRTMCDVIMCSAPKVNDDRVLVSRISYLIQVASYKRVDTLILGAWGCGRAKQNPKRVAEIFKGLITNQFKTVIFAVLGNEYGIFKEVFEA